ncbi:MAG: hypothetical protein IJG15_04965 [Lachnospiraceae bacterium]|nr:hypothetical protein [Lachnospiraceae bacterium]
MSVYIPGIEMPESCQDCIFCSFETDYEDDCYFVCHAIPKQIIPFSSERQEECPLIPVPPHGRLIDADALIIDLMDRGIEGLQTDDWHEIQQTVEDAPAIISAEKEEQE